MPSSSNLPYRVPMKRTTTARRRAPAKVVEPLLQNANHHAMILTIDQTIGNSGYAYMELADGIPYVIKTGCVKTEQQDGVAGFEDTLQRACVLRTALKKSLEDYNPTIILHEMPALYGRRTDSALVAATVVRLIGQEYDLPVKMISAQHVKKVVAGKANATKAEVKTAVRSKAPSISACKPFNEHVSDAVAIGLTYFLELS